MARLQIQLPRVQPPALPQRRPLEAQPRAETNLAQACLQRRKLKTLLYNSFAKISTFLRISLGPDYKLFSTLPRATALHCQCASCWQAGELHATAWQLRSAELGTRGSVLPILSWVYCKFLPGSVRLRFRLYWAQPRSLMPHAARYVNGPRCLPRAPTTAGVKIRFLAR